MHLTLWHLLAHAILFSVHAETPATTFKENICDPERLNKSMDDAWNGLRSSTDVFVTEAVEFTATEYTEKVKPAEENVFTNYTDLRNVLYNLNDTLASLIYLATDCLSERQESVMEPLIGADGQPDFKAINTALKADKPYLAMRSISSSLAELTRDLRYRISRTVIGAKECGYAPPKGIDQLLAYLYPVLDYITNVWWNSTEANCTKREELAEVAYQLKGKVEPLSLTTAAFLGSTRDFYDRLRICVENANNSQCNKESQETNTTAPKERQQRKHTPKERLILRRKDITVHLKYVLLSQVEMVGCFRPSACELITIYSPVSTTQTKTN